jgi:hypothetical protein
MQVEQQIQRTKKPIKPKFIEGRDYYFNSRGLMVMTVIYHLKRGECCKSGCLHCPWSFQKKD